MHKLKYAMSPAYKNHRAYYFLSLPVSLDAFDALALDGEAAPPPALPEAEVELVVRACTFASPRARPCRASTTPCMFPITSTALVKLESSPAVS